MLLHCDLVVAGSDAFLQFPFVDLGITTEGAGSLLLPILLGHARTMDLLLTGRRVSADEALRLGLITRISPDPLPMALDLARDIAAKSPEAVAATKRLARKGLSEAVVSRFAEEIEAINGLLTTRTDVTDRHHN